MRVIGRTIGHYRIEAELGRGGMGVVYRAKDERLGRDIALKLLPPEMLADSAARARLLHEARTASALNHPHICTIHEVGEAEGQTYLAMEHIEGRPLSASVPADGLPAETVIRYAAHIAAALAHAHAHGIAHRDLKSSNVVITSDGRAKVLDFGLARRLRKEDLDEATRSQVSLGEAGGVVGTLHYLSPEVLRGEPADARSDLWALGVVLYEMATGKLPFRGQTGFELSSAILREPPAAFPPSVPAGLRSIIQRCLAKGPEQRYQQASEVRAALEALASDSAVAPVAPAPSVAARRRPIRAWSLAIAGALVAMVGVLVLGNVGGWRERLLGGAVPEKIESLAVLPLKSLGPGASDEYLGMGLADTIITKVSQIGQLTVRPSSAVRKYATQDVDALEAARQLRVDSVLDGSVQRSGDRLRVNVNLLRVRDGASLWSHTFNVAFTDIFAVQDDISQQVASGLRLKLSSADAARLAKRHTENAEAYEFYLKGMQHLSRRGLTTAGKPVLDDAIRMFEKAIELDPGYALAHAQLAYSYTWMALFADPGPHWLPKVKAEVQQAEKLDPNLAELHLVRHELYWSAFEGFKIAESVRELRLAEQLNPNVASEQLGVLYAHMGLEEPALRAVRRALELDPSSELNQARYTEVFDLLMRPDEAIAANQRLGDSMGSAFFLRKSYLWKNRFDLAERENARQLARNPNDPFSLSNQALLAALRGKYAEAEAAIPGVVRGAQGSRAFHHVTYNVASIYALQGKTQRALEWLRKTVDFGMPNYTLFSRDPHLDPIRKDPGFLQLMNEVRARWESYQREFK